MNDMTDREVGELLIRGLEKCGFSGRTGESERIAAVMGAYIKEIELFNAVYDLVGAADRRELAVRHILDSLAPFPVLELLVKQAGEGTPLIADVGSGAGLPGIPLAAAFPGAQFHLIERMAKRCAFLENCAALLGLRNVTVENTEAERALKGRFDITVFRAFRPLDVKMTGTLLSLLRPEGWLAAYKGKKSRIEEEMSAISKLVPVWKAEPVTAPFLEDEERHLVLIASGKQAAL
jgi:16S rRNA (guanine527-N7)-methyltransferase